MIQSPRIIPLPRISGKGGFLSFMEEGADLPLIVKRVYWIYGSSEPAKRGNHAHPNSDRIIICMHGSLHVEFENLAGEKFKFDLTRPDEALYFPRLHWIDLTLAPNAVMTVFTSCLLEEDEVVKDYQQFRQLAESSLYNQRD